MCGSGGRKESNKYGLPSPYAAPLQRNRCRFMPQIVVFPNSGCPRRRLYVWVFLCHQPKCVRSSANHSIHSL